jgi:hypothetical protein
MASEGNTKTGPQTFFSRHCEYCRDIVNGHRDRWSMQHLRNALSVCCWPNRDHLEKLLKCALYSSECIHVHSDVQVCGHNLFPVVSLIAQVSFSSKQETKAEQTSWLLIRKPTVPTEWPPRPAKSCPLLQLEDVVWSAQRIPSAVNLCFLERSRYILFKIAPNLFSRSWVDPIPDSQLLRNSDIAGIRTRDLWICNQELWPLDHRTPRSFYYCHVDNFGTAGEELVDPHCSCLL